MRQVQARPTVVPAELPALLAEVEAHLATIGIREDDARDIALAAWSEVEGRRTGAYVDLELSTPYLIFLADPITGVRWPLPTADLVRMLGPRAVTLP
jgi:isopentenyl diphosphate isomerase/L-lactate dehydrogenase-like FMN-dependent dehydrogenase